MNDEKLDLYAKAFGEIIDKHGKVKIETSQPIDILSDEFKNKKYQNENMDEIDRLLTQILVTE